tara:strand:+ start:343 stop:1068 length:726 start_codon:yes stop_codon:yes gene_type:complete
MISSCSSKKKIVYLQDLEVDKTYFTQYSEHTISVDDILKINVIASEEEAFLNMNSNSSSYSNANNKESMLLNGFHVNINGEINFPKLGYVKLLGLSVKQAETLIKNKLVEGGYLLNPHINIRILNLNFTILGEINNPGKYDFLKDNLSLMEAIGIAGDLTINGRRDNIRVIRNFNGEKKVLEIDLTEFDNLNDDIFTIMTNDIIIVNPNSSRIKNAGIIGNSGTLLTLLSFILSSIIVINN